MISDREKAAFEAGIKLGAIYHQWVGTPLSSASAKSLEDAITKSHILQPYVTDISVSLDREAMAPNTYGYCELTGMMLDISLTIRINTTLCRAHLHPVHGYPLMEIEEINEP
ncbi:MAG: dihydroneopterin aldolase family protein [Methanospirillaceae archaeon]|nr:dihydroneopterin aldolase family protein [Methanospirillaceae archaeon]